MSSGYATSETAGKSVLCQFVLHIIDSVKCVCRKLCNRLSLQHNQPQIGTKYPFYTAYALSSNKYVLTIDWLPLSLQKRFVNVQQAVWCVQCSPKGFMHCLHDAVCGVCKGI